MGFSAKAAFGIPGLDDITAGGLTRSQIFLLEGHPGTGKTTIALKFLLEGARAGERCLHITLSETEEELRAGAASHGWSLGPEIDVYGLAPPLGQEQQQSLLHPAELELAQTTQLIFDRIAEIQPSRVVIDSLSEIRLIAQSSLRYRRQILELKHYFSGKNVTVLLLDDLTAEASDQMLHSIAHGVIRLEQFLPEYGAERRRVRIFKYRGQSFRGGHHDLTIKQGGVQVFPRLVATEHRTTFKRSLSTSDIPELDALLGGGIHQGSSTLIIGPAGAGKSTFGFQFVVAAARRGEKSAMYIFEEELGLLFDRTHEMGFDLEGLQKSGLLHIEQVDAAELSPGEFAHAVRARVEEFGVKTVVIDSLNGYRSAMPGENALLLHVHELLQFLNRQGASTYVTVAQHGLVGNMQSPVDVTYVADTVILLRFFEAFGEVRRAVSVIKKRTGPHERTIREYFINSTGLALGPALKEFQGVLSGVPSFSGSGQPVGD